jgi:hypothetical protein
MSGISTINPLDHIIGTINTSPYVSSIMMLLLNLGGRFLGLELTKGQEKFFTHPYVRRFLIFCIMFVATRNILIAIWMTLLIIIVIGYITNETSAFCIFGRSKVGGTSCSKEEGFAGPGTVGLTTEEEFILKTLLDKKARIQSASGAEDVAVKKDKTVVEKYKENIAKIM